LRTDSNDFAEPYSWDTPPIDPAITPNHHFGVINATLKTKTQPETTKRINKKVYIRMIKKE
jgi:hypothetical protein